MTRSLTLSHNMAIAQATAVILSLPRNSKNEPILFSTNICIMLPLMKVYACQKYAKQMLLIQKWLQLNANQSMQHNSKWNQRRI